MKNYYYTSKAVKMGVWSLLPNDIETWHGEHTNRYFKKLFGIGKGLLLLNNLKTGFSHVYVTKDYLWALHKRVDEIIESDYKALEKKLRTFYPLLAAAKKKVSRLGKKPSKMTNSELAQAFYNIRDRIHHLAIYDQFAWLAEEYWTPKMDQVLVRKLGLRKGSESYNQALFALTKPEKISTTLLEKKAVIEQAWRIKNKLSSLSAASQILADRFGWLPVFCYGIPWTTKHYQVELKNTMSRKSDDLKEELKRLNSYSKNRKTEIKELIKKYHFTPQDLQIFFDFGLAMDTRNEAEYFVSYGGYYLLALYNEIAKRLFLSVKQVRFLFEQEMLDALLGKVNPQKLLENQHGWNSLYFNQKLTRRINFTGAESEKLFKFLDKQTKLIQGGDENKGLCASPGKAKGKVRIVPSPEQNHKVKKGDILFTYATTTDYLPAMKQASAIITEVGGMTCHAAVVSREFGIPCIVALTNAMKNFKDGDLVEVDANNGTVKKI